MAVPRISMLGSTITFDGSSVEKADGVALMNG